MGGRGMTLPKKMMLLLWMLAFAPIAEAQESKPPAKPEPILKIQTVTPVELKKWRDTNQRFEIIDVRAPEDFAAGHLMGARNVPFYHIGKAGLPKDRPLILYCSSQQCSLSSEAVGALLKRGYSKVWTLLGGLEAGLAQGLGGEQTAIAKKLPSRRITAENLVLKIRASNPPMIVDVRPELEYKAGHLPGALNIPLEQLSQRTAQLPMGREVVVYDRNSTRSNQALELLEKHGVSASELEGGIQLWSRQDRPLSSKP